MYSNKIILLKYMFPSLYSHGFIVKKKKLVKTFNISSALTHCPSEHACAKIYGYINFTRHENFYPT
jgi:hypothetical protein